MSLANILWLVVAVIVVLWLIGLVTRVAGNLILSWPKSPSARGFPAALHRGE